MRSAAISFFDGASEVRLVDVIAPGPLEAFGEDATRILNRLITTVALSTVDAAPIDRWERRVAKVSLTPGGQSLQEALVSAGAVRVRPESGDDAFVAKLLLLEDEARAAKKGPWADWRYRVFDAKAAEPAGCVQPC